MFPNKAKATRNKILGEDSRENDHREKQRGPASVFTEMGIVVAAFKGLCKLKNGENVQGF